MTKADSFCVYPFLQLHLSSRGTAKPCCAFEAEVEEAGHILSAHQNAVEELWNSRFMREVRRKMVAGEQVVECGYCTRYRARGLQSIGELSTRGWAQGWMNPEMRSLEQLAEEARANNFHLKRPEWIDLHVGNTCNLECRMCCAYYSSRIAGEPVHAAWEEDAFNLSQPASVEIRTADTWVRNESFLFDDLLSPSNQPRTLNLIGGEPTLVKAARDIMRQLVTSGAAKAINLSLTTNATTVDDEWCELAGAFRSVTVAASIDGLDKVNAYIRHPARWRDVEHGLAALRRLSNAYLYVNATVQVYNLFDIVPLAAWCDQADLDFRTTLLEFPKFLSPGILPAIIRREAARQLLEHAAQGNRSEASLSSLAQALTQGDEAGDSSLLRQFMLFTNDLDAVHGLDVAATFPTLLSQLDEAQTPWVAQTRFAP